MVALATNGMRKDNDADATLSIGYILSTSMAAVSFAAKRSRLDPIIFHPRSGGMNLNPLIDSHGTEICENEKRVMPKRWLLLSL